MVDGNDEIEAKWRADEREHERLRAALRQAGASCTGTVREVNTLFDTADDVIRLRGQVLRLRRLDDGHNTVTLKGPSTYRDGIKTRRETEVGVADGDAMRAVLNGLGFGVSLEYRKTRESWDLDGTVVALDTLEFGRFVEIEADEDRIRRAAALLGLDMNNVELRGYPSIMRAHESGEPAE